MSPGRFTREAAAIVAEERRREREGLLRAKERELEKEEAERLGLEQREREKAEATRAFAERRREHAEAAVAWCREILGALPGFDRVKATYGEAAVAHRRLRGLDIAAGFPIPEVLPDLGVGDAIAQMIGGLADPRSVPGDSFGRVAAEILREDALRAEAAQEEEPDA